MPTRPASRPIRCRRLRRGIRAGVSDDPGRRGRAACRSPGSPAVSVQGRPLWLVASLVAAIALAPADRYGTAPARGEELKTLAECIDIALRQQSSLKAIAETVEAGHWRVWQATSGYLPQVTAIYSANRLSTSLAARTGTNVDNTIETFNFYTTGVSLSQMIFDFGQTLHSIRAAEESERSLEADEVTRREEVVLNVKQSYFGLLAARRLLGVADETLHNQQSYLEQAGGRVRLGLAAKVDVTQVQVQLSGAELGQVAARSTIDLARENLRDALGSTAPLDFDIVDVLGERVQPVDVSTALTIAYDDRPELTAIQSRQRATAERISALKTSYLPYVIGGAGYNWSGNNYPLQATWNIGAAVNLSILNGGLTRAQIGEAEAELGSLKFEEDSLRQSIALEVRRAVIELNRAAESRTVTQRGEEEGRENLQLIQQRYRSGLGSILELTEAQRAMTTAEANHVQALFGYHGAIAALERAIGKRVDAAPDS